MLFTYGDTTPLSSKQWITLELKGEDSVEVYLKRIAKAIPGVFRSEPIQVYVPVKRRDLDEFELFEGPFIYVRSDYFVGLMRLRKVWGVVGLVTRDDSGHLKDVIRVDDEYVQRLMKLEAANMRQNTEGLMPGKGVRILDGFYRDFCAQVVESTEERVLVLINMGFRKIELETHWLNLRSIPTDGVDCCWTGDLLGVVSEDTLDSEAAI